MYVPLVRSRLVLTAVATALVVPGLAACGWGGSGGEGESDDQKVEAAIESALTSTGAAACSESRTAAFMEETTSETGAKAERECEASVQRGEGVPDAVAVSKIKVDGEGASAEVAFKGGEGDGLVLDVALVEEDGAWKIDEFLGIARLDRDRFVNRVIKGVEREGAATTPQLRCLSGALHELSDAQFERAVLGGGNSLTDEIIEECESAGGPEPEPEVLPEYPRAVQQAFLGSCLEQSGSNFAGCECTLEALELKYPVEELLAAEENLASGRAREMLEYASLACA